MPYLFNGKELDSETNLTYFGARYLDMKTSLWLNVDPLAEKYPHTSPYTYVNNNPIMLVDPDGRDIIGVTRKDAQNFQQDIYRVLKDKKFEGVRALISIKGSKFNKIDVSALTKALENISVNTDEKAYIDMVANTINSKEIHKVEYLSGDFTSAEGATAFRDHMNKAQEGIGDMLLTPDGNFSSTFIDSQGGGLNVPTKDGSHSFISAIHKDDDRAITSGHELFGHGILSAKKMNDKTNNSNAIRTVYICIILFYSFIEHNAQTIWEKKIDSLALISRDKSDKVLKQFDEFNTSKILYSLEDKYYYLIIQDIPYNKEYYIELDDMGNIKKVHPMILINIKNRKQQKQYSKLLSEAGNIFDSNKYHKGFITKISDAKLILGIPSYFVFKDRDDKRYGEYRLPSITLPLPINSNLWAYLIRRLSDEIKQ